MPSRLHKCVDYKNRSKHLRWQENFITLKMLPNDSYLLRNLMRFLKYCAVLLLISPLSHADLLYCKDQSPYAYPKSQNSMDKEVLDQKSQIPVDCKDLVDVMKNLEQSAKKLDSVKVRSCEKPASSIKNYLELKNKCEENPRALEGNGGLGCDKLWLFKQHIEREIDKNLFECSRALSNSKK